MVGRDTARCASTWASSVTMITYLSLPFSLPFSSLRSRRWWSGGRFRCGLFDPRFRLRLRLRLRFLAVISVGVAVAAVRLASPVAPSVVAWVAVAAWAAVAAARGSLSAWLRRWDPAWAPRGLGRNVVLGNRSSRSGGNRRGGKFHAGRPRLFHPWTGCGSRRLAFQLLPCLTESLHVVSVLRQLLPFRLGDRLES